MRSTIQIAIATLFAGSLLALAGCPPEEEEGTPPIHVEVVAECENLEPDYCMLPWPSSRYLAADSTSDTGWRVDYVSEAFPENEREDVFDVEPYNVQDGFPPSAQISRLFEMATRWV